MDRDTRNAIERAAQRARQALEEDSSSPSPTPHHANIRGAAYYAEKEIEC